LLTSLPVYRGDHLGFGQVIPCADEDHGQYTVRDMVNQRGGKQNGQEQPHAMKEGRHFCFCSGFSVGRTSDDNRCDGDATSKAGQKISGALGYQLTVLWCDAITWINLVDGLNTQQCFK